MAFGAFWLLLTLVGLNVSICFGKKDWLGYGNISLI